MHVYAIVCSFSKNNTQKFDKTRVDTTDEQTEKKQLFIIYGGQTSFLETFGVIFSESFEKQTLNLFVMTL